MTCFEKMFRKEEPKENKTLQILLKVFLIVGIVAGICVVLKFLFEKYKKDLSCICDDDLDDLFDDEDDDTGSICDGCDDSCDVVADDTAVTE